MNRLRTLAGYVAPLMVAAVLSFAIAPIVADSRNTQAGTAGSVAFLPSLLKGAVGSIGPFGFGRDATSEEIAAWDIDVRPDGTGLPAGSGTVAEGGAIYLSRCSACHGLDGTGGSADALVKPFEPGAPWPQLPRTIGNYWPYATTVYDYVNRAMPFSTPNSLGDNEVYALVAWLLNQNGIISEDAVMNAQTLPAVKMPAEAFFRPQVTISGRLQ